MTDEEKRLQMELDIAHKRIADLEVQVEGQAQHLGEALQTIEVYKHVDGEFERTYPKDLTREYDKICYRLSLLTPGGSEFYRNPDGCLHYLEYDYQSGMDYAIKAKKLEHKMASVISQIEFWLADIESKIAESKRVGTNRNQYGDMTSCHAELLGQRQGFGLSLMQLRKQLDQLQLMQFQAYFCTRGCIEGYVMSDRVHGELGYICYNPSEQCGAVKTELTVTQTEETANPRSI